MELCKFLQFCFILISNIKTYKLLMKLNLKSLDSNSHLSFTRTLFSPLLYKGGGSFM